MNFDLALTPYTIIKSKYIMILLFLNIFNVYYVWETQTEHEQGRGRERERETESEAASRLWAVSTEPNTGLELTDHEIMTWAKIGPLMDWATQAPEMYPDVKCKT